MFLQFFPVLRSRAAEHFEFYRAAPSGLIFFEQPFERIFHIKAEEETRDWLPAGKLTVGITAGASCPNNLIEETIRRLFELRGISVQELVKK